LEAGQKSRRLQKASAHSLQDSIELRRTKVIELVSKGKNLSEIGEILNVDVSTISRDYKQIKENASRITEQYLNETVPLELAKCLSRLNSVSDEAWAMVEQASDYKEKIAALSLAMRAAVQLVNLVTNQSKNAIGIATDDVDEPVIGEKQKEEGKKSHGKKSTGEPDPAESVF
jgi:hypothetical protein